MCFWTQPTPLKKLFFQIKKAVGVGERYLKHNQGNDKALGKKKLSFLPYNLHGFVLHNLKNFESLFIVCRLKQHLSRKFFSKLKKLLGVGKEIKNRMGKASFGQDILRCQI